METPLTDFTKNWALSDIRKATDKLEKYVEQLEQTATEVTGKIMPITNVYAVMGKRYASIESYKKTSFCWSYKDTLKAAEKHQTELWEKVEKLHQENLPAIENNEKLLERIRLLFHNIGISEKRYEKKGKKDIQVTRGWLQDLYDLIPRTDLYREAVQANTDFLRKIQQYREANEQLEAEAEKKKRQEEKKIEADMARAALVVKYNLPYDSSFVDIMDHLLGLNKYLNLAYHLERNRGDWSDGYEWAETGLEKFQVVTDQDKLIYSDINTAITEWGGDGRVFRDMYWNYNALYNLVEDKALLDDFRIVYGKVAY